MTISIYLPLAVVAGCIGTIATVIVGLSRALKLAQWPAAERRLMVWRIATVLGGWFALAVALAVVGTYHVRSDQPPTIAFGIMIPILIGSLLIWRSPAISRLIDAIPRHWVVAIQVYRVEGVIFLILYGANLLPGLFAVPAGVGDMVIGLTALYIGFNATRQGRLRSQSVWRWNVFGIADLVVALTTGLLTSPSPFQIFAFDHPNQLISMFPLVLIPTFLVPLAMVLHVISLIQLRRASARVHAGLTHAVG